MRSAILASMPADEHGVEFLELPGLVRQALPAAQLERLGSISWYTTTVKLNLETRGEIERIGGPKPQRLRRQTAS